MNEAWMRLLRHDELAWKNRDHFLALAARAMRSVLVDHARTKNRRKRSPLGGREPLTELVASYEARAHDLVELDEALQRLGRRDPRAERVVELRFFAGLGSSETAAVLDISLRSVERD